MELTKRSNFRLDITNIATTPVVIKKGLKAIDFIGTIVELNSPQYGRQFGVLQNARDSLDGTVVFSFSQTVYTYDPATGQITVTT